ncbi:hypothetical protein ACFPA8_27610 [Streptomyces ovatisporus]|uniref:Uncharacterized protein n=1 Tax=Streptomyces ovatisporus TaxID=1128682 RepID=A0ABV9AGT1_9ACTN
MTEMVRVSDDKKELTSEDHFLLDLLSYFEMLARLALAGRALRKLSSLTEDTFGYVTECAASVDQNAELAASLNVDRDVVAAHHDAADLMRSALKEAEAMADEAMEMAALFDEAATAHEADYGPIVESAQAKKGNLADRGYYANQ